MGLIDIIRKLFTPPTRAVMGYQDTSPQGKYRPADYAALVARYEGWVYKCGSLNAHAIAASKIGMYVKGGTARYPTRAVTNRRLKAVVGDAVELETHPALDLLDKANPVHTGHEVLVLTALYLELTGNAYWFVDRDNPLNTPTAIYPLMSQHVRIVKDADGFVIGYIRARQVAFLHIFLTLHRDLACARERVSPRGQLTNQV